MYQAHRWENLFISCLFHYILKFYHDVLWCGSIGYWIHCGGLSVKPTNSCPSWEMFLNSLLMTSCLHYSQCLGVPLFKCWISGKCPLVFSSSFYHFTPVSRGFLKLKCFPFSPPWGFHSCIQFRFTKLDIFPLYIPFVFVWDFSDFIKTLITVFFQSSIVFNTIFFSACGYIGGFMQPLR